MVIAVGVDVVEIRRLDQALTRTAALRTRLFGPFDLADIGQGFAQQASLAARFAAKEAALKCLGGNLSGFSWHDIQVRREMGQAPQLVLQGAALRQAEVLGVTHWHLSLSHDAGIATAVLVAESRMGDDRV